MRFRGRRPPLKAVPGVGQTALAGLALLATLALAGCGENGESSKTPAQILKDSAAALVGAHSYQIKGELRSGSQRGSFTFEVGGYRLGAGTFDLGSLSFQLKEVKATDYLKSNTLWESLDGGAMANLLAGRWVSIPASNSIAEDLTTGLEFFTSPSQTAAGITKDDAKATRKRGSTVDGQEVLVIDVGGGGSIVSVATSGPPYPLQVASSSGSDLRFSDFGESFSIKAPPKPVSLLDVIAGVEAGVGGGSG